MEPDDRHIMLGSYMAVLVVSIACNVYWRHCSRYGALVFPGSFKTAEKRAIRVFFAVFLFGSLWGVADVIWMMRPTFGDLAWSFLYTAIIVSVTVVMDAIVTWLNK